MFLRFLCFTLLVCAFNQVHCVENLNDVNLLAILNREPINRPVSTSTATASSVVPSAAPAVATASDAAGINTAPKGTIGDLVGNIVNNTKHVIHFSSNVVLGGVKTVGNVIKSGWDLADNVVDGSLDLAKKMGSLGFKIITVVPKSLNNVLLDIVEKGQNKLKEKLMKEQNENTDYTTEAPEMMFIYLNNQKIPVSSEEIIQIANALKGSKQNPMADLTPTSSESYFLMVDNQKVYFLTTDDVINLANQLEIVKKKEEEKNKSKTE